MGLSRSEMTTGNYQLSLTPRLYEKSCLIMEIGGLGVFPIRRCKIKFRILVSISLCCLCVSCFNLPHTQPVYSGGPPLTDSEWACISCCLLPFVLTEPIWRLRPSDHNAITHDVDSEIRWKFSYEMLEPRIRTFRYPDDDRAVARPSQSATPSWLAPPLSLTLHPTPF